MFVNTVYFAAIYPIDTKKKFGEALCVFFQGVGVTERLTMDEAPYQIGWNSAFMKEVQNKELISKLSNLSATIRTLIRDIRRN